jgi:hypothetical protein
MQMLERVKLISILTALSVAVLAPGFAAAKEESKVKTRFMSVGGADGAGKLIFKTTDDLAKLKIKLKDLDDEEHTLDSNDVERALFDVEDGRATLVFTTPQQSGDRDLFFDPREGEIVIRDAAGTAILKASLTGDGGRTNAKEETELEPTALANGGIARARFDHRPNGREQVRIHLKGAPEGDYQILFDGVERAEVTTNAGGNAKVTFLRKQGKGGNSGAKGSGNGKAKGKKGRGKSGNRRAVLDFDGVNALIEIVQGSDLYWSGPLRAQILGLTSCDPVAVADALTRDASLTMGDAVAEYEVEDDCEREFAVEVEDITPGLYSVWVGGAEVGDVDVMAGVGGKIEFSTDPDVDELPLTFDPIDQLIEVRDGGTTLFSGTLTLP